MIKIKNWNSDESDKILALLKEELKWEFELTSSAPNEVFDYTKLHEFQVHKINSHRSAELLVHFPAQTEKVQLIECLDSLVELQGKLWPELLAVAAIKRALIRKVKTLNLRRSAYVVGDDIHIRPLVMAATELGFHRISLVSKSQDWLQKEKDYLSRRLVGIQLSTVLLTDLTLQAQDTNLLLCSFDLNANHDEYMQDLAYFNFMLSGGVLVDLHSGGAHQVLQDEATKAQLTCVKPREVLLAWWLELGLRLRPALTFSHEIEEKLFEKVRTWT